jgi:hypothetical protein
MIIGAMGEMGSTPLVLGPIRVVVLSTESMYGVYFRAHVREIQGKPT